MPNTRTNSKRRRGWAFVAAATAATTLMVSSPAQAAPLFESHTTVAGYPFFSSQGPRDLHVIVLAEVSSPLIVGTVTEPTVTFTVGVPGRATFTLASPIGPCVSQASQCFASRDFHADISCDPAAPLIWVRATYSGEALGPPLNLVITPPSTSDVQWISRCPTETF